MLDYLVAAELFRPDKMIEYVPVLALVEKPHRVYFDYYIAVWVELFDSAGHQEQFVLVRNCDYSGLGVLDICLAQNLLVSPVS